MKTRWMLCLARPLGALLLCLAFARTGSADTYDVPSLDWQTIQSAIDQHCASGSGCLLRLPCGKYEPPVEQSPSNGAKISIQDRVGVRIQGCGRDATWLKRRVNLAPGGVLYGGILAVGTASETDQLTSRNITIQDLTLEIEVTCGSGGTTMCTPATTAAAVVGPVEDVIFERVHMISTLDGSTPDIAFPAAFQAVRFAQVPVTSARPEGVSLRSSSFQASRSGVLLQDCDDCWVEGSYFEDAPMNRFRAYTLLSKLLGSGVRITNNTFDMQPHGPVVSPQVMRGVALSAEYFQTPPKVGEGAQVIGNSFIHTPNNGQVQDMTLYGYNGAVISNNRFACETKDCGVIALGTAGNCNSCNKRSVIANNVFDSFVSQSGGACPVYFSDSSLAGGRSNLVVGNQFVMTGSGPGVCGPNASYNTLSANFPAP